MMGAMSARAATDPAAFGHGLNPAQRRAATCGAPRAAGRQGPGFDAGPLLIIAGAGTGKTNTLAHRVAHLLLQQVAPERIALLTFTRRAAQELLARAERIARAALDGAPRTAAFHPNAARMMWSGTFHSVGNRLLREYAHVLGLDPAFSVIDRGDAADLIDLKRQELGLAKQARRFPRKDTCLAIYSHRVNTQGTLAETLEAEYPWCADWHSELTRLFRGYVAAKQAQQLLDYDDLLLYWHLLTREPAVARELGGRFEHVLVDEYQDTNTLQADILLAMKPDGAGLCVVGDDAQSIYSFRAATVENILEFAGRFPTPAEVITLDRNYRSVQPILDAANALMAEADRGYRKHLESARPSAQKPWYVTVEDERNQSLYVVEQVLAKREDGTPLRRQAVLMRSAHHSDLLEVELTRRNIPYVKYGGLKFLEAAHVKDVLALLRWVDNPKNRLAGFRTLQLLPGIGPAHADRCLTALEDAGFSLPALLDCPVPAAAEQDWRALVALACELNASRSWAGQMTRVRQWYEPHLERLHEAAHVRKADLEQLELIALQSPSRERFLTELTLDPPQATGDQAGPPHKDEDYLILSTVHSAKGQEWDSVYLLNVTDGSFPGEFAAGKPAQVEEERRLLYVAITRAKHDLHLVAPLRFYVTQQHRWGDRHVYGARSRFMSDAVLAAFEARAWPAGGDQPASAPRPPVTRASMPDRNCSVCGRTDMKLYDVTQAPNPRRVRIYLAEKGIEVPLVQVDMRAGEHKSPEFLARNPSGKVPVLELDDGTCIGESIAICRYFEALQPEPALVRQHAGRDWPHRHDQPPARVRAARAGGPGVGERAHRVPDASGPSARCSGQGGGGARRTEVLRTARRHVGGPGVHGRRRVQRGGHHRPVRDRFCGEPGGAEAGRGPRQPLALARRGVRAAQRERLSQTSGGQVAFSSLAVTRTSSPATSTSSWIGRQQTLQSSTYSWCSTLVSITSSIGSPQ